MSRLPTDREVLQCIYTMYESAFPGPPSSNGRPENDPYLPIDVSAVAQRLEVKPELLFGRLYYHLDQKYRYKQNDGTLVPLFYLKIQEKRHVVHFPYLAAILAGLENEYRRQAWALSISVVALILSIASLLANLLKG
jgi:hypothetical protein